jgi:hypothetical protein
MTPMAWQIMTKNRYGSSSSPIRQQLSVAALQNTWRAQHASAPNVNWSEWAAQQDGGPHFVWVRKENTYWVEFLEIWCNHKNISVRVVNGSGRPAFEVAARTGVMPVHCDPEEAAALIAQFVEQQLAS